MFQREFAQRLVARPGTPLLVSARRSLRRALLMDRQDILREACIYRQRGCADLPPRMDHATIVVRLSQEEREVYRCAPRVLNLREQFAIMIRLRQGACAIVFTCVHG